MQIRGLGELELIKKLFNTYSADAESQMNLFPHDDCAVLDLDEHYLLITTDLINKRTHLPEGASGFQVGWFLMAINLSDLAAKGGVPVGFLNALALPSDLDVVFIEDIANGLVACGRAHSCPIIGGDTKSSSELTLTGIAMGTVLKDRYMPRYGCVPGDLIAVTGDLGRAGFALQKLKDLSPPSEDDILRKLSLKLLLEVKPRLLVGQMLGKLNCINASIDLSDGLGTVLHQLGELNNVGFKIIRDTIPQIPMLNDLKTSLTEDEFENVLLYTGGDYELLVSLEPAQFKTAQTALQLLDVPLTAIGKVQEDKEIIITTPEGKKPLKNRGFDHFK